MELTIKFTKAGVVVMESDYDYRPEQPKAKVIGQCEVCECDILKGYYYFEFYDALVCEDCFISYCLSRFRRE